MTIPFYVYLIIHKSTGKFYFGSRYIHTKNNTLPEHDLWIKYFTSSKEIKNLILTDGVDAFFNCIIYTSFDHKDCFLLEQELIKINIKNNLCLNKRYFDTIDNRVIFCNFGKTLSTKGKSKSDETKIRMKKPKSKSHRENISKAQKVNGGNGPKTHSEVTKQKIANSLKKLIRPKIACPHCNKLGGSISMKRWHFDNCKNRKINE